MLSGIHWGVGTYALQTREENGCMFREALLEDSMVFGHWQLKLHPFLSNQVPEEAKTQCHLLFSENRSGHPSYSPCFNEEC